MDKPFDFRAWSHRAADWAADYQVGLEGLPVRPKVVPGSISDQIQKSPPEAGEPMDEIFADFDNISGLKDGASVEIAGVKIGQVTDISLDDSVAVVRMRITNEVKIRDDDIAAIRTKGIIGDKYIKVSRGASDIHVGPGERMTETESCVDIEDIIGKLVHNFTGGDDDEDEENEE